MTMISQRFEKLQQVYSAACAVAPALAARFAAAGLSPAAVDGEIALSKLPVLKKETLMVLQQEGPPYAGLLGCRPDEVGHVYISPGPIFEPSAAEDKSGHGMQLMFAAAGLGPGDLAVNTWSYHLVPAGLLFDQGLRAVGAAVIPAGTGNSELQIDLLLKLPVTAFLGSTAFFETLIEKLEEHGHGLPTAWRLRHAFLGGEFGDWMAKRRHLERTYNIKTWSCYGTANFGLIGYEQSGADGYLIHPDRYVQICDPESGIPLPPGTPGEIVVTTLSRAWPMIRFGTGDVSTALELDPDGGAARIALLQVRVSQAVKAREIFIYPRHIEVLPDWVRGLAHIVVSVGRNGTRNKITANVMPEDGADAPAVSSRLRETFASPTRLKLDHIELVADAATLDGVPALQEARTGAGANTQKVA